MTEVPGDDEPLPPLPLVALLLRELEVPCEAGPLQKSAERRGGDAPAGDPSQWLREVLVDADIEGLIPVMLPWSRFDLRRLPALLDHDGIWYLASKANDGSVLLTAADGSEQRSSTASLDGARVLWIRQRPETADAPEGNLARHLVWTELFRERGWLWQIVVATVLVNLIGVSTSLFAMQVYDRVVPTMAYATLTALVVAMTLVVLLDWTLKRIRAGILDSLAAAVDRRVSQRVFEHLLHVRLDAQPRSIGSLAARVSGLESARQFFSATVVFALVDLPFALMFVAFIAVIGGAVAWVYVLLLPAALLLGLLTQWRIRSLMRSQLSRSNERQGLLIDSIRGAESIRASNASGRFAAEWREMTASINGYRIRQRAISNLSSITTGSLSTTAYVGAVVVGVWQIEAGLLTMGGLIACSILGGRVIAPVAQSVQYLAQWQHVSQALALVHEVLALEPERRAGQQLLSPVQAPDALSLEGVRFSYPDSPVRQLDIDTLRLEAGDRILLLGPVGSGKSTLLKVLAGLYRPSEGRVRLGRADLWETDPGLVSRTIGYLPQTVHLFKGTLRSNLSITDRASDDQVLAISEQLGLDAIAAGHPLGLDLPISEGGDGLSGGQRQLVALARVMLGEPRVWLLDEPTASLDRDAEERFWQTLEGALRPTDVLVVCTHRPLVAGRLANRVLILQAGRVTRDGSPETLLPQLVRRPAGGETIPGGGRADVG